MYKINDFNFNGKKALLRVDFNVPIDKNGKVTDTNRIESAIPSISKIIRDKGKAVVISHLGRPKSNEDKFSLIHILPYFEKLLGQKVQFIPSCTDPSIIDKINSAPDGSVFLLENLRFYEGEKKGDREFAQFLSELGDVYVNDAFGVAHRAHASTAVVAEFFNDHKMFGFLMEKEIEHLDMFLKSRLNPIVAVMGGVKVSDKVGIIENLMEGCDYMLIGGAMAYTFIKAKGGQTGSSLIEVNHIELAKSLIEKAEKSKTELIIPQDSIIAEKLSEDSDFKVCESNSIPDGWMGLDIGPKAIEEYSEIIKNAKTVLWNGPMGVFELKNFEKGTQKIAKAVAEASSKGAFTLVGGGDSIAALEKYKLYDKISYVSTGGGAMLEYLEGKTLPGIQAIKDNVTV